MASRPRGRRDPPFEGGAQPVPDRPPDEPGPLRGPAFVLIMVLGLLVLAMPIGWGLGAIVVVGDALGTAGLIAYWVVWLLCIAAIVWLVWAMWRRAG